MIEVLYLFMVILGHTFACSIILLKDSKNIFLTCAMYILIVFMSYGAWAVYRKERCRHKTHGLFFHIHNRRMHYFMLILTVATFIFFNKTGIGLADSIYVPSKFSFIFGLVDINALIWIYYFLMRDKEDYRIIFWFNITLYCIYMIMSGWTGFVLSIGLYELYFWAKKNGIETFGTQHDKMIKIFMLALLLIVLGSIVYSKLLPLKYIIRYGSDFGLNQSISYIDVLERFISRFSYFPDTLEILDKFNIAKNYYIAQGDKLIELKSNFRPIVPKQIMGDKYFMSVGTCIASTIKGYQQSTSTYSVSALMHFALLLYISPILAIIELIIYILSYKWTVSILRGFEEYHNQFEFLIFFRTMKYARSLNVETLFFQSYGKMIFIIPILLIVGCIDISVKSKNKSYRIGFNIKKN